VDLRHVRKLKTWASLSSTITMQKGIAKNSVLELLTESGSRFLVSDTGSRLEMLNFFF
jgi:hypothetical protein